MLKQKLAEMGVHVCGVVESHTYRDAYLSDGQWAWDPGVENRPKSTQPHPPGGIGVMASRKVKYSIVGTSKYSVWVRLETESLFHLSGSVPHPRDASLSLNLFVDPGPV